MKQDPSSDELKDYHANLARETLIKTNQSILKSIDSIENASSAPAGQKGYSLEAMKEHASSTQSHTYTGQLQFPQFIFGSWQIWDIPRVMWGFGLGALGGVNVTWGALALNKPIEDFPEKFHFLLFAVAIGAAYTNMQFWRSDNGAYMGCWNGGGIGVQISGAGGWGQFDGP